MPKQAARRYPYAYLAVFDYVVRAIPLAGDKFEVRSADAATGVIDVSSSMNLATWGQNITLRVGADGADWTRVELVVAMKLGLVDWGQRGRDIKALFRAIDSVLPGGQPVDEESARLLGESSPPAVVAPAPVPVVEPAPVVNPPAGWHPDPHGRHEHRYWDGNAWTEHVSNAGQSSTDPIA